ncbi:uncharacterized protein LOC121862841 [Homarus americanus]|uniref:uncharacterized protein LOC121862841 n=1 Tax=Homarus americanus TaxID=6706 RepID=UPI001C48F456|nr:uncharacterized protein LOC121862841 [Homarus americanus]
MRCAITGFCLVLLVTSSVAMYGSRSRSGSTGGGSSGASNGGYGSSSLVVTMVDIAAALLVVTMVDTVAAPLVVTMVDIAAAPLVVAAPRVVALATLVVLMATMENKQVASNFFGSNLKIFNNKTASHSRPTQ